MSTRKSGMKLNWLVFIGCVAPLFAQSPRPTVVLLNGYQATCGSGPSDSSATFGSMQSLLAADGWTVAFFDNCSVRPGTTGNDRPTIEELAQAFGAFLNNLGVSEIDVVAHSMGGLIVRAWLAGKQPDGTFSPPLVVPIRKAVFIATPHAGLLAIAGIFGANDTDSQTQEMFAGSDFLWSLATWNQRMDDLRGIDALSIAGNNGGSYNSPHSHDGVVVVTSASLAASLGANRVRVLPYCHEDNLPSPLCSGPGIAHITDRNHPTYRIVTSFLSETADWQTIGADASEDKVLSQYGGVLVDARDSLGNPLPNPGSATLTAEATANSAAQPGAVLPWNSQGVSFADYLRAGQYQLRVDGVSYPLPIAAGGHVALDVKQGPKIDFVAPVAGNVPTLSRAPGMLIAVYGANLADASVTIGGISSPVFFNSSGQINTIVPEQAQGLALLSAKNSMGQDSLNILIESAVPAIFSADGSGTGAALAFHADASAVSPAAPARTGETISIFLTGLGVSAQVPAIQTDSGPANVIQISPISGLPGIMRLDFVVPDLQAGSQAIGLQAVNGAFSSNAVTLYVAP